MHNHYKSQDATCNARDLWARDLFSRFFLWWGVLMRPLARQVSRHLVALPFTFYLPLSLSSYWHRPQLQVNTQTKTKKNLKRRADTCGGALSHETSNPLPRHNPINRTKCLTNLKIKLPVKTIQ
jgi:hypothetical protein